MRRVLPLALVSICLAGSVYRAQEPVAPATKTIEFERDVQPILRQHCYSCHGPAKQQNGLRLDRRRDAMRGGSIAVIGPGNSDGSRLYQRLIGSDFGRQMPPDGALSADKVATIRTWIDQGAEWPDAASGETPPPPPDPVATRMMDALRAGNRQSFNSLVSANAAAVSRKGPDGSTPLMYAVLYGDAASTRRLLDAHADPNVRNDAGATALMWAGIDLEKARLLIDHGADVNARSDDGRTPLVVASGLHGARPVVQLLLDHGAKTALQRPGDPPALVEALYSGDQDVFMLLMEHGADPTDAGPAALWLALHTPCPACAEKLLTVTPADLITGSMVMDGPPLGRALAAPFLLEHGADASATDSHGRTMLMLVAAADDPSLDAVRALLARGVNVNAKSPKGETALSLAKQHGRSPLIDLLIQAGAAGIKDESAGPVAPIAAPAESVKAAIERSLPLLQKNDETFLRKSGCVSCHNNTLTAVTVSAARRVGLTIDEDIARAQLKAIGAYVDTWRDRALQGMGIPGDADTVSYILLGMAAENYPPDATTEAMARFLKRMQTPSGKWTIVAHRPPLESSDFQVTAVSMRALQAYAPKGERAAYQTAVAQAARWLATATPISTEDRAFQLMGMMWSGGSSGSGAAKAARMKAGVALIAEQRRDGGWAQTSALDSDAYATGQVLVALSESGAFAATDPAIRRGVEFLMKTQAADGTWFVPTRAIPIQPHFESGFPYGRSQFISAAATNWATRALVLAYTATSR